MPVPANFTTGHLITADEWNAQATLINTNETNLATNTANIGTRGVRADLYSEVSTIRTEIYGGASRTQKPRCAVRVTNNGYQTINNATDTMLNWETEVSDTDAMFTAGGSGITVPVSGRYLSLVTLNLATISGTVTGAIGIKLLKNTTDPNPGANGQANVLDTNTAPWNTAAEGPIVSMVSYVTLTANDVVRVSVWQNFNNGTAQNTPVWTGFGNKGTTWDLVYQGQ